MTPRRAVVTGGAGFLGSHLCERLLDDGVEVVCLDNFLTGTPANVEHLLDRDGFRLLRRDVTEYVHVPGPVDAVLHFASPASPVDYLKLPIQTMKVGSIGTLHALGLAKEKGARFLLASTSESYGDPQVHPQPESYWGHVNPVGPRGVYDEAKRFAEALTMAYRRTHGVDTAIVRIFNSILADEQVLYDDGEQLRRESIGDLAARIGDNASLSGYRVPAFDAQGRAVTPLATDLVGHPTASPCFEVTTRYGRSIRVSGDHSLFVQGGDGRPVPRSVSELSVGDAVAIAATTRVVERDRGVVSMLDVVREHALDPWSVAVHWPDSSQRVHEHRADLLAAALRHWPSSTATARRSMWGRVASWQQSGWVPLGALQAVGLPVPPSARIRLYKQGRTTELPVVVPLTDEFLWFLGLYVAEGCWYDHPPKSAYINVSCEEGVLDRAQKVLERDVNVHCVRSAGSADRGTGLTVHGTLVLRLLAALGFGAGEKRIPGWILGLPLRRLGFFLEGYREGDGVHSGLKLIEGKRHEMSTTSTALKDDLVVAFSRFGLVASVGRYETTLRQRTGDRPYPFWRLTLCNVSPWSPLDWHEGVHQVVNAQRTGDLVWARIRAIEPVTATPLVYDFCVPGHENFLAGTGVMAHNTYGERMRPDDGRAIPTFIRQALRGDPLTVAGDGSQTRSVQYVDDLVEGVVRLLRSGHPGPINIGNPHELSVLTLAETIRDLVGSTSVIEHIDRPVDDPTVRRPDIGLAHSALGWEPRVGLDEGLARTIAWFRRHPQLVGLRTEQAEGPSAV